MVSLPAALQPACDRDGGQRHLGRRRGGLPADPEGHIQARPLRRLLPANTYTVEPGDSTIHMYVIQSMFKSLSHVLDGIRVPVVDGRHTGVSVENASGSSAGAG